MKYYVFIWIFLFHLSFDGYTQSIRATKSEESALWKELKKKSGFKKVFKKYKNYRFEILFTQIDRGLNGEVVLKNFHLGDSLSYFYPASTVKLPTAIAISEMLLKAPFYNINKGMKLKMDSTSYCHNTYYNTNFEYHRIQKNETWKSISKRYRITMNDFVHWNNLDTTQSPKENAVVKIYHREIRPSINELISSMLVYSDNNAYNKLFDVVGGEYFKNWFSKYGFSRSNVTRKFLWCEGEEKSIAAGFEILNQNDVIIYRGEEKKWLPVDNKLVQGIKVGKKHFMNGNLVASPRDFSDHNRILLSDLHKIMQKLIFPSAFSESEVFNLDVNSTKFIIRKLGQYPKEDIQPLDNLSQNWEDGRNIFLFDGNDTTEINPRFRIANIIGQAYGFTTDCMYFTDDFTKTEFFLSVRIYTNKDEILGNDKYEYDDIAMPMMKFIGQYFFEREKNREREVVPNFALFRHIFD